MSGDRDENAHVPPEVMEGMALSSDEARALEDRLEQGGGDASDRVRLVGYYLMAQLASPDAAVHSARHVLTLVLDHPEAEILGTPLGAPVNEAAVAEIARLWKRHIEHQPRNTRVLENAARFFSQVDRAYAEHIRYRLRLIDADRYRDFDIDYVVPQSGAAPARSSADALEAELAASDDPVRSFHLMVRLCTEALREGKAERAAAVAQEVLAFAPRFEQEWIHGSAIHDAHQVLGVLALQDNDVRGAVAHLLEAGNTQGSPQLSSFGPEMGLAKRLLEQGERAAVLEYLRRCRRFWKMGAALLDAWTQDVAEGRLPNFVVNARL